MSQPSQSTVSTDAATVVAFYLPQYHRVPENDHWWGEGFTEWTNVKRATPRFTGHRQPRVPGGLGYYDLLDPGSHASQQAMARKFGVGAFCYYAYWFNGQRLLERPLEVIRSNRDLSLPYCLCWANENWTRTWDGLEREVLMPQRHDAADDADIIDDLAEHLTDERYVRIDGAPLLIIYRASILDDPMRTTDALRARAEKLGIGELHLAMVQSMGAWDPRGAGFDSAVEFPPHNADSRLFSLRPGDALVPPLPPNWRGILASYPALVEWCMSKPAAEFAWFRGVIPGWDNTPRRGDDGVVFLGDTTELFRIWMERALHHTYLFNPPGQRLLFVNAWNEWAEGAYLEPDLDSSSARLEAVRQALESTAGLATSSARGFREGDPLLSAAQLYLKTSAVLAREVITLWRDR